jgi:hypothetical protein
MAGIFINYRRDDAPGVAGRLFDYLALKYPRQSLFMDVDAMKPGMDFAQQLDAQVAQCRVLLAVIGPRWFEARDKDGHHRLDSDKDYVRIELASALKREIPVIPVLVDGATLPPEEGLADDLRPLVRRHALELRHTRFNADAEAIVHALEAVVPRRRTPWSLIATGVVAAAVVALVVAWPRLAVKLLHPATSTTTIVAANPPAAVAPLPAKPAPAPAAASAPTSQSTPPGPTLSAPSSVTMFAPAPAPPAPSGGSPTPSAPSNAGAPAQTVASLLGADTPSGLPPNIKLGDMMNGIIFRGSVLRLTDISADPAICQAACRSETRCVVWTYRQPVAAGQPARCSLKTVLPESGPDSCCTSAIERVPSPELRVPPAVPPGVADALPGIELDGGTYTIFGGTNATPEACQAACRADAQCIAWDYSRPGVFASDARCFLKNKPSVQVSSPCCIAGFERHATASTAPSATAPAPSPAAAPQANANAAAPAATAATKAMLNTNLFGSDYRNFAMSSDDWSVCQNACKADRQCLAWTAVRPGIQGPNARCWLKNKIPQPRANACCTSGIERAAAN